MAVTADGRVAITGLGLITAHGVGTRLNWERTAAGVSSLRPPTLFDAGRYRARQAGEVPALPQVAWRRFRKERADRASVLLYHATAEALAEAALPGGAWAPGRAVVILGTSLGGMAAGERYHAAYLRKGPDRGRASCTLDHLAHAQPLHVLAEFGIRLVPAVLANACASGANAIGHAFRAIRQGRAELALCGGYDPLCEFAFAGFHALQALTAERCRPFDRARSGLAIGEGAAILVLEAWARATGRGAPILGEVLGYGESNDAFHVTRPDPSGQAAARAVQRALADAGLAPETIGYVNAHGTGTPFNDAAESAALLTALGPHGGAVPLSSTKAMIGHMLGAAGAGEAILSLLALRAGTLPPNLNYEQPDPACRLHVLREAEPSTARVALSNSFGFGGANAALLLGRGEA